ncbi:MAG: hypothetical protein UMR38_06565 [Candidatus Izemoplasma sp.]|nr:hypothetical protein [Candidatus Izemoplasma sp.]
MFPISSEDILDELQSMNTVLVEISINDKTEDYLIQCDDFCIWGTLEEDHITKINTPFDTYVYDDPSSTWEKSDSRHTYYGYLHYPFDAFTYDEETKTYHAEDVNMGSQFTEVTLSLNEDHEIIDQRVKDTGLALTLTYKDLDAEFDVDLSGVCPDTYQDGMCYTDYETFFDFTPDYTKTLTDLDEVINDLNVIMSYYDTTQFRTLSEEFVETYQNRLYPEDVYQEATFDKTYSIESSLYNDIFSVLSLINTDNIVLGHSGRVIQEYEQITCCEQYGETKEMTPFNGDITVFINENTLYVDYQLYDEDELSKREVYLMTYDDNTLTSFQSYQFDNALDDVILSNRLSVIDYHRGEEGSIFTTYNYLRDTASINYTSIEENGSYTTYHYSQRTDNNKRYIRVDQSDEYFYLDFTDNRFDNDILLTYKDGVFVVSRRRIYDRVTNEYLAGNNNNIAYNLLYLDGWDYVSYGDLYKNDANLTFSNPIGISVAIRSPYYSQYFTKDMNGEISRATYETPLSGVTFDEVSYSDFQSVWQSVETLSENFTVNGDIVVMGDMTYDFSEYGSVILEATYDGEISRFFDQVFSQCDDCIVD